VSARARSLTFDHWLCFASPAGFCSGRDLTQPLQSFAAGSCGTQDVCPSVRLTMAVDPSPATLTFNLTGADAGATPVDIERSADGSTLDGNSPLCSPSCGAGSYPVERGKWVELHASPPARTVYGWSGCASTPDPTTCWVRLGSDQTVSFDVGHGPYQVSVAPPSNGTVELEAPSGSVSCPDQTCSVSVNAFDSVTLVATGATNYHFASWDGGSACAGAGSNQTCTLSSIVAPVSVGAPSFALDPQVTVASPQHGSVQLGGKSCPGACSAYISPGDSITLSASPDDGYVFHGWGGDCTGKGDCTLTNVQADKTVSAAFVSKSVPVTVSLSGSGGGTLTSQDGSVNCTTSSTPCAYTFQMGSTVSFIASADLQSTFTGWTITDAEGATLLCKQPQSSPTVCAVDIGETAGISVDAAFGPIGSSQFQLSVAESGTGAGTVTSDPGGISCAPACTHAFLPSVGNVTLTASAAAGSHFVGWTGACNGTSLTCSVAANGSSADVGATFDTNPPPQMHTLTVTPGTGTVRSTPAGIDCSGSPCSAQFPAGSKVTLTATPSVADLLAGWGGACQGDQPTCTLTLDQDQAVSVTFVHARYPVTITNTSGAGTVTSTPSGIDCGSTCTATFPFDSSVSLAEAPSPGALFDGWAGACAGTGACSLTIRQDTPVEARFAQIVTLNSAKISGSWKLSQFHGHAILGLDLTRASKLAVSIRAQGGQVVAGVHATLAPGKQVLKLALPTNVRPGPYTIRISGTASAVAFAPLAQVVTLHPPATGVVESAFISATPHGGHALSIKGRVRDLYASFTLAAPPRHGVTLTMLWLPPHGRPVAVKRAVTRVVTSHLGSGHALPRGIWRCVLRAGSTPIAIVTTTIS
jgi:hypothetical protein